MSTDNVVPLHNPRQEEWARAFIAMEDQIYDLTRVVDLALHVWLSELEAPITDNGSCMQLLLEDLVRRARKLRSRYRPDSDGADDPAA